MLWPLLIAAAYLIGSIPFGFFIARAKGIDIREHGSGNIGATNVGRVLGPRLGKLCLVLDILKGLVPALGAGLATHSAADLRLPPAQSLAYLAVAAAAVLGHMFPVWLKFRGGKGVATGLGALLGVFPVLTIGAAGGLVVWLTSVRLTRYIGVSSCLAAAALPVLVAVQAPLLVWMGAADGVGDALRLLWPPLGMTVVLGSLVIVKHRANLARTLAGTEPRVGERKPPD